VDALRPGGFFVEDERTEAGEIVPTATVLLTGAECPWRCVMCDLWKHTLESGGTPPGALALQLDLALAALAPGPRPRRVKLYNAGSFFDPRAVPLADYEALAARLQGFERVVVESHPALIGERVDRWRRALGDVELEVAMGLETAHPEALAKLHKRMTLEQFAGAARALRSRGVALRAFVLVPSPFVPREEEALWVRRSVAFAFDCGASAVSLIPLRGGNGAMEALREGGAARLPRLVELEAALANSIGDPRGRVFADLWDLRALSECTVCLEARRQRLHAMNLEQRLHPATACGVCGGD
jgi:radical SAM enzyme (TIGR01210 family)